MRTIEVIFEDTMKDVKSTNDSWITADLKAHLEKLIAEALRVTTDEDGNWNIEDSSVRMAVDDILTYYDLKERA